MVFGFDFVFGSWVFVPQVLEAVGRKDLRTAAPFWAGPQVQIAASVAHAHLRHWARTALKNLELCAWPAEWLRPHRQLGTEAQYCGNFAAASGAARS